MYMGLTFRVMFPDTYDQTGAVFSDIQIVHKTPLASRHITQSSIKADHVDFDNME